MKSRKAYAALVFSLSFSVVASENNILQLYNLED